MNESRATPFVYSLFMRWPYARPTNDRRHEVSLPLVHAREDEPLEALLRAPLRLGLTGRIASIGAGYR